MEILALEIKLKKSLDEIKSELETVRANGLGDP